MIVAVAALLLAASLSIGLRTTSGWLDHWHPMDRLLLAIAIGALLLAASLMLSSRYSVIQAGYGLAFSLAPVGVYDIVKWWYRSRPARTAWLIRSPAAPWLLAVRWAAVVSAVAAFLWVSALQWQVWTTAVRASTPAVIDKPLRHTAPGKPVEAFDPTDPQLEPPRG